jgi:hypothetical protein
MPGNQAQTIEVTSSAPDLQPEPKLVVDRRGQSHHQDATGRFVRKDGKARSTILSDFDRSLLPGIDRRSLPFKRYKALVAQLAVDQGGEEELSTARAQLIRRFAATSVLAELLEHRLATGEVIDVSEYSNLVSTQVRVAQRIGLDRVAKNVGELSLGDLWRLDDLAQQRAKAEARAAAAAAASTTINVDEEAPS